MGSASQLEHLLADPRIILLLQEFQVVMLQAVRLHKAHLAVNGKKEEVFG